ncbi:hypothetical protein XA68_16567 [Ophiocordyceps unilateralis]|uniref:DUF7729 domain-containing protein n=1 Tax=Ophiocordyceps unilateralis TaxID=268505 RepID=A0A2A9PKC8_OPHUN|nr:hypothetical protein XA68_16567 [Ophiocordyceps unilateralis]
MAPVPSWRATIRSRLKLALALLVALTCIAVAQPGPSTVLSDVVFGAGHGAKREVALPEPFDNGSPSLFQGAGSDDRCPTFMSKLLSDGTFKNCHALSMLLQTSTALFEAEKQTVSIVRILDASCAVDVSACADYLAQAAERLRDRAHCRAELDEGQPRVVQAWRGLRAYRTLYAASCLQDRGSGVYCFATSVSNLTDPSDSYLYFMPLGVALPGASTPSCTRCTRDIMDIYHDAAANRGDLVADKYADAAQRINVVCGPAFANATLPGPESGSAGPRRGVVALAGLIAVGAAAFGLVG